MLTDDLFSSIWQLVDRETKYAPPRKTERRANFTIACAEAAAIEFDIEHIQSIESAEGYPGKRFKTLDKQFLDKAIATLPPKPWDNDTLANAAIALGCERRDINLVVEYMAYERTRVERRQRALLSKQRRQSTDPTY